MKVVSDNRAFAAAHRISADNPGDLSSNRFAADRYRDALGESIKGHEQRAGCRD